MSQPLRSVLFAALPVSIQVSARNTVAAISAFLLKGRKHNRVLREGPFWVIKDSSRKLVIPCHSRQEFYRYGIEARLDHLYEAYGVSQISQLKRTDVIIDIGANIGEFSLRCSRDFDTVHAIEADPNVFKLLVANSESVGNIFRHNIAIWSETKPLTFYSAPDSADSSIIEPDKFRESVTVSATTLDDFCKTNNITNIGLIKCDAEGAEPEVLKGATDTLKHARAVAFDCGAERLGQTTIDEVTAILKNAGFIVSLLAPRQVVLGIRPQSYGDSPH